ncbi:MAG: thiamine-phosphate kinase [Rhodocyclaceae bacterium]|nr:thiamine-phosphate kinase [Rhodocyclaceae bacterium]
MAGEFALIEHLLRQTRANQATHPPVLGPGDDCALIQTSRPDLAWAVTTDMLVAGVHFLESDNPRDLGWKTLAVNLSDLAAMGAVPRYVTLAAAIHPADAADTSWLDAFFAGFIDCADTYGVALIGGDTTRGPRVFSVTAMGEVLANHALRRSGAQAGDDIWVSGTPGYATLGLQAKLNGVFLPPDVTAQAERALHHPVPRVSLGLGLNGLAHSAIDVSDGMLQDLGHIAQASGLDAMLSEGQLPPCPRGVDPGLWQFCLLGGGDDYELLFTAPVSARRDITGLGNSLALPLTRIGSMRRTAEAGTMTPSNVQVLDEAQKPMDLSRLRAGFDHFA